MSGRRIGMRLNDYAETTFLQTDFRVISFLSLSAPNRFTVSEILNETQYSRNTVNTILKRLFDNKIITREYGEHGVYAYSVNDENKLDINELQYIIIKHLFSEHKKIMAPNICRIISVLLDEEFYDIAQLLDRGWKRAAIYKSTSKLLDNNIIEKKEDGKTYTFSSSLFATVKNSYEKDSLFTADIDLDNLKKYFFNKNRYDIKRNLIYDSDSFDRIMKYYAPNNFGEAEDRGNSDIGLLYDFYGWSDQNQFDVLYSFWNIFSYGLHQIDKDYYYITESGNIKNAYKRSNEYFYSFPEKYLQKKEREVNSCRLIKEVFPEIIKLAEIVHSSQNFYPVLKGFNCAKGLSAAKDFLPLMIDLIEKHIKEGTALEITEDNIIPVETLDLWKRYFISNRERFSLEKEYIYDTHNNLLIGIPLFDGQSLDNPLPAKKYEYEQCLQSVINRIEDRNINMVEKIFGK